MNSILLWRVILENSEWAGNIVQGGRTHLEKPENLC